MAKKHVEPVEKAAGEAARLRASAKARLKALGEFWITFGLTGVILVVFLLIAIRGGLSWFASNTRVSGTGVSLSFSGQPDFALATVGTAEQGVYDADFGLTAASMTETLDGVTYYIASGNSSFRVESGKNLNNYLANADLRPGNRGSFDLYVIRRSDRSDMVLRPVFSVSYEDEENAGDEARAAANYLKGHILLFANIDEKGMYSGNIDYTQNIALAFGADGATATQKKGSEDVSFDWGKAVYSDESTKVYRLPVYWVWPEQFGNFIYTGNSYNKNLFSSKNSDYIRFVSAMENDKANKVFFCTDTAESFPAISTITNPNNDYQTATQNYELYSGWYDAADEQIGTWISYIELGFEIAQD